MVESSCRTDEPEEWPDQLTLQWHITERCNLRCSHCYQDIFSGYEVSPEVAEAVLDQYHQTLRTVEAFKAGKISSHINVTGGEPMMSEHFWDIMKLMRRQGWPSIAVHTNGTFLDEDSVKRMRMMGLNHVQVGLDGLRATHDAIRGKGTFDITVQGIRLLVENDIPVVMSFTAHRTNWHEFSGVAKLAKQLGVGTIRADRMLPCGPGVRLEPILGHDETERYVEEVARASNRWRGGTIVAMDRPLQFLGGGVNAYHCQAGMGILSVLPKGDVMPCRRLPYVAGNLFVRPLTEIYLEDPMMRRLRRVNSIPNSCANCTSARKCRGGSHCLAYAITGDPFAPDPGCWLATKETSRM